MFFSLSFIKQAHELLILNLLAPSTSVTLPSFSSGEAYPPERRRQQWQKLNLVIDGIEL